MTIHNLKLKEEYVVGVMYGEKTFELRKNDRDYKVGDYIHFIQVNGQELIDNRCGILTTKTDIFEDNLFKITYILENVPEYGLDEDYCILGIKRVYIQEEVL